MATTSERVPKGYHSLIPYLNIKGADKAIDFYVRVFGAKEIGRITMADGLIAHCELEIGDSRLMLAEENPAWGNQSPDALGDTPVTLCLYVDNVDEFFSRALREGATVTGDMDVKDQFYGDRSGNLTDPFGHKWMITTHIEDMPYDELQKQADELFTMARH